MNTLICPNCNQITKLSLSGANYSYTPTGGDYTWIETSEKNTCEHCQDIHDVRVQIDVDTNAVNSLMQVPKSYKKEVVWHAIASIHSFGEEFLVSVIKNKIFFAEADVRKVYEEDFKYTQNKIVKITSEGYRDENDNLLIEAEYQLPIIKFSLY